MRIYILRHGIAEGRRTGLDDAKRALTEDGKAKLRQVLDRAAAAKVTPSVILTSPYLRAEQTARMAAEVLGRKTVVQTEALLPGSSPENVWREIRAHAKKSSLLLAGHEPLLSETASWLLGAGGTIIDLKKGAMLSIAVDTLKKPQRGVLEWLLTPKLAAPGAQ
ncbi:MAG TPA: histidine phosphatase family protein [Bryobacteraceae bacterium]